MGHSNGHEITSVSLVRPDDVLMLRFDRQSLKAAYDTITDGFGAAEFLSSPIERRDILAELHEQAEGIVFSSRPSQGISLTFSERWLPIQEIKAHEFFIHGPELEMRICCCSDNRRALVGALRQLAGRGDFLGPIGESLRGVIDPVSRFIPDRQTHVPTGFELLSYHGDEQFARRAFLILFDFDRVSDAIEALKSYAIHPSVPRVLTVDQAQRMIFLVKEQVSPPSGWD